MAAVRRISILLFGLSMIACGGRTPSFTAQEKSLPSTDSGSGDSGETVNTDDEGRRTVSKPLTVGETSGKADILFVIDNSASMAYEQRNMADRFRNMISLLDGIDWQVAVTTTETGGLFGSGGVLQSFAPTVQILASSMDEATADGLFRQTIQRSETGTNTERGMTAVADALGRIGQDTANTQFFRNDSHLAVVIISDEDESFEFFDRTAPEDLLTAIGQKWSGQKKSFTAHSIITKPDDFICLEENGARFGTQYAKLSALTGGIVGSVCATDYAKQLADIGKNIVKKSTPTVELICDPIDIDNDGAVDILLNDEKLAGDDYFIDGGKLSIKRDLGAGDYQITYYCAPE